MEDHDLKDKLPVHIRDETGRYETGLPWRGNHPPLPNN